MNKVYMANLFSKREEMEEQSKLLTAAGYDVVSSWVFGGEEGLTREDIAVLDIHDVNRSDIVISFTYPRGTMLPGGGRHVEFGYGFAVGKRMVLIGHRENVFHHLPGVELYETLEEFIKKNEGTENK